MGSSGSSTLWRSRGMGYGDKMAAQKGGVICILMANSLHCTSETNTAIK